MKNNVANSKREERAVVSKLKEHGFSARRQPGSGNRGRCQHDDDIKYDVVWHDSPVGRLQIEDKYRDKPLWKTLEQWRDDADILTVRCARGERMAFLSFDLLMRLVG